MKPIAIRQATLKRLLRLRLGRESYDSLLNRLIDTHTTIFPSPSHRARTGGDKAKAAAPPHNLLPYRECRAAAPADPNKRTQ